MKRFTIIFLITIILLFAALLSVSAAEATVFTPEQILGTEGFLSVSDLKYELGKDDDGTSYLRFTAGKGTFNDGQLVISLKESATELNYYTNSYVRIGYRTDTPSDTMPCNIYYKHRSFENNSWYPASLTNGAQALYSNGLWNDVIIDIKDLNANIKIGEDHIDMVLMLKPFGAQVKTLESQKYFDIGYIGFFETEEEAALYNDPDTKFADMYGHWAMETVNECVERGLFNGTSATKFSPNNKMTRAMLAVVLYRIEGNSGDVTKLPFADTPRDSWFSSAIAWAADTGIVDATGNFRPDENITREEIADMLYKYAKNKNLIKSESTTKLEFADSSAIRDEYKNAIAFCVDAGIIKGYDNNTVNPSGEATRAEVATMVIRYINYIG